MGKLLSGSGFIDALIDAGIMRREDNITSVTICAVYGGEATFVVEHAVDDRVTAAVVELLNK